MKSNIWISVLVVCALLLALSGSVGAQDPDPPGGVSVQAALGTSFTYQGRLTNASGAVSGNCDLRFKLYDQPTGGAQIGSDVNRTTTLDDGYFAVTDLDFGGGAFNGQARWLEIAVRCPAGSGSYNTLGRQELTAAPYALYAAQAPWIGLTGVPTGLNDGDDSLL